MCDVLGVSRTLSGVPQNTLNTLDVIPSTFGTILRKIIFPSIFQFFWPKFLRNCTENQKNAGCGKFDFPNFHFKVFFLESLLPKCRFRSELKFQSAIWPIWRHWKPIFWNPVTFQIGVEIKRIWPYCRNFEKIAIFGVKIHIHRDHVWCTWSVQNTCRCAAEHFKHPGWHFGTHLGRFSVFWKKVEIWLFLLRNCLKIAE